MARNRKILSWTIIVAAILTLGFRHVQYGSNATFQVQSVKPVEVQRIAVLIPENQKGRIQQVKIVYSDGEIDAVLLFLSNLACRSLDVIPDKTFLLESGDSIVCSADTENTNVVFIFEAEYSE